MTAEAIVAHRINTDGVERVEVDRWPAETTFVEDLSLFDPALVRRVGDLILVTASNGHATYRIVVEDKPRGELECVLEDSELTPRGPF